MIVVVLVTVAILLYIEWKMIRPPRFPPGPPRWPLVGNLYAVYKTKKFGVQYSQWCDEYGPICSFKLGEFDAVIISDFDVAKEVLAKDALADRPQLYYHKFFMNFKNVGLIHSNGRDWKEIRRFTLRHLRDFGFGKSTLETLILDEFKELVKEIRPQNLDKTVPNVAELGDPLNAAVTNVIWWIMACKRVTNHDQEFAELLRVIETRIDFTILNVLSLFPSLNPFDGPLSKVLHLKSLEKKRDYFYNYMQRIVEDHRDTLDKDEPRDLIDCFLIQQAKLGQSPGNFLTDDMIKATLVDLFTAGAETTSTTLRWFFLYLIHHPQVQERIHQEIDRVIGRDRAPSYEDHHEMPYTMATLWEIWRCVTIVPFGLNRQAVEDIEVDGYRIPRGTIVITSILRMHHDPKTFDSPMEFRPERFLTKDGKLMENPRIMPFQAGRRQCPGDGMARMNIFLGATFLLQLFEFGEVPGQRCDLNPRDESQILNLPRPFKVLLKPRMQGQDY